jgi:hypothetical protein
MTLQNFVDPTWINPKKVDRLQTRYEASSASVVQPVPLAASPCNSGGGMGVQTGTTIRVDGRDVELGTSPRVDFGLRSRIYRLDGRPDGSPPIEWIKAAILRADR